MNKKLAVVDDEVISIGKITIERGEHKVINLNVGTLPSGTAIEIKANIFRAKEPGPCALILGGVHGDEINGVEIVRKSLEENLFENLLKGSVIAIPLLNIYGFINFSREVPDGKDVNRSFPGNSTGSLASRVARKLTKDILPSVNFGLDFHTGGASRFNYPQIRYSKTDVRAKELGIHFAPPFLIQKPLITKSLRKVAKDMNIPIIVYEGGESVRLDGYSISKGYEGMKRVLKSQGMLAHAIPANHKVIHTANTGWVRAPKSGLFQWTRSSGAFVAKGESMGHIKDPYGNKAAKVIAKRPGYIIGHNNASVVNHGDALFHLAYDYEVDI